MRPDFVVIDKPGLGGSPSGEDIGRAIEVERLVANATVERLDQAVLGRLAGIDEVKIDLVFSAPQASLSS